MKMTNYVFKDEVLRETALTHSSYANENRVRGSEDYERLEFLGDSVLGFLCAEYLYKNWSKMPEGELSKLRSAIVCEKSLHKLALEIDLGEHILFGKGEEHGGGRERASVLADCVEALLAAIYLDGGIDCARQFIMPFIEREAKQYTSEQKIVDYKTALQEIVQKNKEEVLTYRLAGETGPDHDKYFEVEVLINSNIIAKGRGKSKKQAEQEAAKDALSLMGQ